MTEWAKFVDQVAGDHDYWGQHPTYPRSNWEYEVVNGDTQRGYWDWVAAQIECDDLEAQAQQQPLKETFHGPL
jgi:hypothetical protein